MVLHFCSKGLYYQVAAATSGNSHGVCHFSNSVCRSLCDNPHWSKTDGWGVKLPSGQKTWCYQFTLYRRLSKVPSFTVRKMDGKVNSFIRKQLGLPRCLSESGLFGKNALQLPLQPLSLGYMQEKTRLVLELSESIDQSVRNANAKVSTGQKWNVETEVNQAVCILQQQEIICRVQAGRARLSWGEAPQFWSRATCKERKEMVVAEVTRMEEELCKIPQARLSFLIYSTYDTFPCPRSGLEMRNTAHSEMLPTQASYTFLLAAKLYSCYRRCHDQVLRKMVRVRF